MRIAIFGGSFDPAHEGHQMMAMSVLKKIRIDRLWLTVAPSTPLKEREKLSSLKDRVKAVQSLSSDPRISVTGFEAQLGEVSYTVNTLLFLIRRYPNCFFVWTMGADCLMDFHRWRGWRTILQLVPIVVLNRPGCFFEAISSPAGHFMAKHRIRESQASSLATHKPPAWVFLTNRTSFLSSSAVRKKERKGDLG